MSAGPCLGVGLHPVRPRSNQGLPAHCPAAAVLPRVAPKLGVPMPIDVKPLAIPDVKLITPPIFRDARGFFSETYNRDALSAAGIGRRVRAGQPVAVARQGRRPRPALPDRSARSGQARARRARLRLRRRRRHPPRLADLRPTCLGHAVRRQLGAAVGSRRLCPCLLHARARHGGDLQGHRLLRARVRPRPRLRRSRPRHRMADRHIRGDLVRQGPAPSQAARPAGHSPMSS